MNYREVSFEEIPIVYKAAVVFVALLLTASPAKAQSGSEIEIEEGDFTIIEEPVGDTGGSEPLQEPAQEPVQEITPTPTPESTLPVLDGNQQKQVERLRKKN